MRRNQKGFVVSVEIMFILVFLVMGVIIGWTSLKDAVVNELSDTAAAIDNLNQTYSFAGMTSHSGSVAGSQYLDEIDYCQDAEGYENSGYGRCITTVGYQYEIPR